MGEDKISQVEVAKTVSNGLDYVFIDHFLVKPLDEVMVEKEFSKPVVKGEPTEKDGIVAQDYDEVETEVKEVPADYRKGVVIKVPHRYTSWQKKEDSDTPEIKIGDIVTFHKSAMRYFDLFKDSAILRGYDIIAVEPQ